MPAFSGEKKGSVLNSSSDDMSPEANVAVAITAKTMLVARCRRTNPSRNTAVQ